MSTPSSQMSPSSFAQGASPWNSGQYTARTFFTYESDITATLATNTSATLTFNIAGDSDFFWTKFAAFALVAGTATTYSAQQLPAVTILIVNTTTGRQYSSAAVPLANMAGTAQFPFILPQITLWQKKSTIQITLQNEGSTANGVDYSNLHLSFHGIKAFTTA